MAMSAQREQDHESIDLTGALPTGRLSHEAQSFFGALADRAAASVTEKVSEKVGEATDRLIEKVEDGGPGIKMAVSGAKALAEGKSPFRAALSAGATGLKEKVKQIFGGGKGGGPKKGLKLTDIVESLDVGVPIRLVYNQWTQFPDFPSFMKKVEHVEPQEKDSDQKLNWKAQIWWSHRSWESTIVEQVPDDHIVWRSKGAKGYVDGAVSFHELAPNLTRILLVMEYHPQGLFEHTGNLWRAQGRRARLEFKHFRRHVMAHAILKADEIEGWRGEIRDGEVVKTHEEALEEEGRAPGERAEEERGEQPEVEEREEEREETRGEREEAEGRELGEEREEGEEAEGGPEEEEEPPERPRRRPATRPPTRRRAPARPPADEDEDRYEDEDEYEDASERRRRPPRRRAERSAEEEPERARQPVRRRAPARRRPAEPEE